RIAGPAIRHIDDWNGAGEITGHGADIDAAEDIVDGLVVLGDVTEVRIDVERAADVRVLSSAATQNADLDIATANRGTRRIDGQIPTNIARAQGEVARVVDRRVVRSELNDRAI